MHGMLQRKWKIFTEAVNSQVPTVILTGNCVTSQKISRKEVKSGRPQRR